jgi:hypothetical protein
MGLTRAGAALVLALTACGGSGGEVQDEAACQMLKDPERGREEVYDELGGMNLSSELRGALDRVEAASESGDIVPGVLVANRDVDALCLNRGVELPNARPAELSAGQLLQGVAVDVNSANDIHGSSLLTATA